MTTCVISHVSNTLERLPTYLAGEGSLATVNPHMNFQITLFKKGLLTNRTQDTLVVVFSFFLMRIWGLKQLHFLKSLLRNLDFEDFLEWVVLSQAFALAGVIHGFSSGEWLNGDIRVVLWRETFNLEEAYGFRSSLILHQLWGRLEHYRGLNAFELLGELGPKHQHILVIENMKSGKQETTHGLLLVRRLLSEKFKLFLINYTHLISLLKITQLQTY